MLTEKPSKMDIKELINWGELSRMLSGSRQTVRKNKIPKIHQPFIEDLLKAEFCRKLKFELNQENISLEVNNKLYFI